ncbi:MAG: dTDP-4-dehydrorhamnose 3,5-epimerase [Planctomycetaceae bacterium]|nr:dTDP-4-dehydrorhamnose 3,5-epimerase [Planctomycetaceae bacterium]
MQIQDTALSGVLIIEPKVFGDARGFFFESYNRDRYRAAGIELDFVQDNLSYSRKGTLRGLHYQNPHTQGKLVYVLEGEVFDVAVDVRHGSSTFGQWVGVTLSAENKRQFYVPPGFAHGFCVTSEVALFAYKCTDLYAPECEGSVLWCDEEIGIDWPVSEPLLSDKDQKAPLLKDIPQESLTFPIAEATV